MSVLEVPLCRWCGKNAGYGDGYFCKKLHALRFAYHFAAAGSATEKYVEARAKLFAESPEGRADAAKREYEAMARKVLGQ